MIYFNNDYSEGCHPKVMDALVRTNLEQTYGYSEDEYCAGAREKIKALCGREDAAVHFLVGGTQSNLIVIAAALRPHQAVLCPIGGHIATHESGAIEATGHKVMTVPSGDGKITAAQVRTVVEGHRADPTFEHTTQPKLVYISNPTEYGTLYSLSELEALFATCKELGLYLFMDGARMGYGLAATGYDVTLQDIARLTDVFYIGGTKVGAMFGEAVVILNPALKEDFRYIVKQRGAMFAKGRLLGIQFDTLMTDGLYWEIAGHADRLADQIRATLDELQVPYLIPTITNQIFPIFPDAMLEELAKEFAFAEIERVDECHRCIRFCTSWATKQENVDALCDALKKLCKA